MGQCHTEGPKGRNRKERCFRFLYLKGRVGGPAQGRKNHKYGVKGLCVSLSRNTIAYKLTEQKSGCVPIQITTISFTDSVALTPQTA